MHWHVWTGGINHRGEVVETHKRRKTYPTRKAARLAGRSAKRRVLRSAAWKGVKPRIDWKPFACWWDCD